ncbi:MULTISPECIES: class II aldolase/adducin family protein [unclassified Streptomyces]|uniref:class II aldolase/adducin family protein n=1 Tax=unclassified Streptomyces TaxID=2593676 RepID=UPI0022B72AE7|nr:MULTISPECIES: class II aldolase/adducin family protein [unclassified Streptomyces]MCZ7413575.1 class II aldolase/adducin family protein [Streptomyces sp. WMMC897]MCZ7430570.1 class II aldolase/adducin family protein [Streptomyces sp. WMMC1477]
MPQPQHHRPLPAEEAPPAWSAAWHEVVRTARRTAEAGLVVGTSGNVSARVEDVVLVTPSGIPYDRLGPADLCAVHLDGSPAAGARRPTSELPLHLAVYRETDAAAVVHTHAVHATAVSTLVDELPAVHYMAAALGGAVRVAPYATYGTEALATHLLAALRDRTGCLLRNHGTVVHGRDLDQAYDLTAQLEWMCQVWLAAAAVPGRTPATLPPEELDVVAERLRGYGQRPGPGAADR